MMVESSFYQGTENPFVHCFLSVRKRMIGPYFLLDFLISDSKSCLSLPDQARIREVGYEVHEKNSRRTGSYGRGAGG